MAPAGQRLAAERVSEPRRRRIDDSWPATLRQIETGCASRTQCGPLSAISTAKGSLGGRSTRDYLLALNALQDAELRLLNLQLELAGARADAFYLQGELP